MGCGRSGRRGRPAHRSSGRHSVSDRDRGRVARVGRTGRLAPSTRPSALHHRGHDGRATRELLALRWSDVDWEAQRIRVRRSYVLGEFDTPKSARNRRSVPMSMRVAQELDHGSARRAGPPLRASCLPSRPAGSITSWGAHAPLWAPLKAAQLGETDHCSLPSACAVLDLLPACSPEARVCPPRDETELAFA